MRSRISEEEHIVMDFLQDRAGFSFQDRDNIIIAVISIVLSSSIRGTTLCSGTRAYQWIRIGIFEKGRGKTFPEAMNILIEYHNGLALTRSSISHRNMSR
ncbi:MAG: hypothetical protein ACLRTA_01835 [Clostridia bacterium]